MLIKNKKFKWLNAYVLKAARILPNAHKLRQITISYAKSNVLCKTYGALTEYKGDFKLSLKVTMTKACDNSTEIGLYTRSLTKIEILTTLAHELAHIEHWLHTPDHKSLEAKITKLFMTMLAKEGYQDEETELKLLTKLDREKVFEPK